MKMKKTLAVIMAVAMSIGTMAGCSEATTNYSKELANVSKWESVNSNSTGTFNIDVKGVKKNITFTCTGYSVKNKAFADLKFTDSDGEFNIPEMKVYSDGNVAYINKEFYEGIYTLTGQPVPEALSNIEKDYIGIDSASNTMSPDQIRALTSDPNALINLGKSIFGENSTLDIPFVQNGREYTINLDGNQTVDLVEKIIKEGSNNLENINNKFNLKLTSENIQQIKTAVNSGSLTTTLIGIKASLTGSNITSKQVFTDTSYTSDFSMDLKIKDFGNIKVESKGTSEKGDRHSVSLPASRIMLTAEEFAKICTPAKPVIPAASVDANTVIK